MHIGASACPMAAFSGINESHKPPPSGDSRSIVLPHCNGHQNGQQSEYMCCIIVELIAALAAHGVIRSE